MNSCFLPVMKSPTEVFPRYGLSDTLLDVFTGVMGVWGGGQLPLGGASLC